MHQEEVSSLYKKYCREIQRRNERGGEIRQGGIKGGLPEGPIF